MQRLTGFLHGGTGGCRTEPIVVGLPGKAWPGAVRHPDQKSLASNIVGLVHRTIAVIVDPLGIFRESLDGFHSLLTETPSDHSDKCGVTLSAGAGEIVLSPDIIRRPKMVGSQHPGQTLIFHNRRHSSLAVKLGGRVLEVERRLDRTVRAVAAYSIISRTWNIDDVGMQGVDGLNQASVQNSRRIALVTSAV